MTSIPLGVTVFTRLNRARRLFESVERTDITTVYVADVGELTDERRELYDSFDFDVTVLDLEYDSGIGRGRNRIAEALDEEYLLMVDSDVEVPQNYSILADQLKCDEQLGGVSGIVMEPENDRIVSLGEDFFEEDGEFWFDIREDKEIALVSGHGCVTFDLVPNVAVFRRACLEDYCWDPEYTIGRAHADFFVGHWKRTDWTFALCPEVVFRHWPGGDAEYDRNRHGEDRLGNSTRYFLEKWGYDQIHRSNVQWMETTSFDRTYSGDVSFREAIGACKDNLALAVLSKVSE